MNRDASSHALGDSWSVSSAAENDHLAVTYLSAHAMLAIPVSVPMDTAAPRTTASRGSAWA